MPRTFGENQIHVSQILGWCEADYPLVEMPPREGARRTARSPSWSPSGSPTGRRSRPASARSPTSCSACSATTASSASTPSSSGPASLDLIEAGRGDRLAQAHPPQQGDHHLLAAAPARLYEFVAENPGVEFWPVDQTNDPKLVAQEPHFNAINATIEVDFLGQCASESLGSDYWSSSGGQPDFARGAVLSEGGQAFIVLHSTTGDGSASRIVPRLHPGAAVTTFKNIVDNVVTEYGVAELRGSSIAERTRRLIAIAHPDFRDEPHTREALASAAYV